MKKSFISLSVYGKLNKTQKLSLCRKIDFDPSFEDVQGAETFNRENLHLLFIHCNDDMVYVFYYGGEQNFDPLPLDKMLLMTICLKSFSIIKFERVKHLITDYDKLLTEPMLIKIYSRKMFCLKDEQKLFIQMSYDEKQSLVFDTKNHQFYFNTEIAPHCHETAIFSANGNTLYDVSLKKDSVEEEKSIPIWIKIKSYEYQNGKFVDEKLVLKTAVKKGNASFLTAAQFF